MWYAKSNKLSYLRIKSFTIPKFFRIGFPFFDFYLNLNSRDWWYRKSVNINLETRVTFSYLHVCKRFQHHLLLRLATCPYSCGRGMRSLWGLGWVEMTHPGARSGGGIGAGVSYFPKKTGPTEGFYSKSPGVKKNCLNLFSGKLIWYFLEIKLWNLNDIMKLPGPWDLCFQFPSGPRGRIIFLKPGTCDL